LTESAFGSEPRTTSEVTDWPEPQGGSNKRADPKPNVPKFRKRARYLKSVPWAVANWDDLIRRYRSEYGVRGKVLEALMQVLEDDLDQLVEGLPHDRDPYETDWQELHPRWIEQLATEAVAAARAAAAEAREARPSSIKTSLDPTEWCTWERVRKLRERKSQSTGQRKRGPSREKRALEEWCAHNERRYRGERTLEALQEVLAEIKMALDGAKNSAKPALSVRNRPL
jgi:hypothetical protein